jgi:HlyD family secretion protein
MKILKINNLLILALLISPLLLIGCKKKSNVSFQGYTEGELLYIASPFSGELQSLNVHRGQKIKKGSELFSLDPEPERSQLKAAEETLTQAKEQLQNLEEGQRRTILESLQAQISRTKAELKLAALRVKRFQELYKEKAIGKDPLDEVIATYGVKKALLAENEANYAEAKLGSRQKLIMAQKALVAATEAQVQQAQWSLEQKTQYSSITAIVFDTFYWPGEWVAAGRPVLAFLAPQYIRFIFFIPATKLSAVHLGDEISIACDACEKNYTARISYISPEMEYTPPVIYSRENNYNLVYRIKAKPKLADAWFFHPGQPVYVTLNQKHKNE